MNKPPKKQDGNISREDVAMFRSAIGEVQPLAKQNRITPEPVRRAPVNQTRDVALAIPDMLFDVTNTDVPDEYLGNGVSRMTLRKLRRGAWIVQSVLDLHGYHRDEARRSLQEFLNEAVQREQRCILVIHGKGMNSQSGEAVLRGLTRHWLMQHPNVLGYCDAPPKEGGSGAALVLLKTTP